MPGQVKNRTCDLDSCGRKHYAKGWCQRHYLMSRRGADMSVPLTDGRGKATYEFVEYRAAHTRVERARGKAKTYFCLDCNNRADEWSLDDDSATVYVSTAKSSAGKAYSLDVNDYSPRCIKCHRENDGNFWWEVS